MNLSSSTPLVSIVLPTKNRAQFLRRAVKSVLAQTYTEFELIIVDDNSTDATVEVVRSFDDERIHYMRQTISKGPGAARNAGCAVAEGEYIAFLDDDDQFAPNKLDVQVEVFRQTTASIAVVISDVEVQRDGKVVEFYPYDGEIGSIFLHVLAGHWFPLNATLLIRHQLPQFDEHLLCLEDIDFHLKVLQKSKAAYTGLTVAQYNIDQKRNRLSQNRINMHRSFEILLERYFNDPDDYLLASAKPKALANFALRLIALGYTDDVTREYFGRALKLKKSGKMLWYRLMSLGGPALLKRLK